MKFCAAQFKETASATRLCLRWFGLFLCALGTQMVLADTLIITGGTVPNILDEKHPGPHNIIFDDIIAPLAANRHTLKFVPYMRARRDFTARTTNCFYPAIDAPRVISPSAVKSGIILLSRPVNTIQLHAFTRKGDAVISSYADLTSSTVAGTRNQLSTLKLSEKMQSVQFLTTVDQSRAFELLDMGRTNIAVTYTLDAYVTMRGLIAPSTLDQPAR